MKNITTIFMLLLGISLYAQPVHPYMQKKGNATQLIVDGKPFLVLGGELGNSSFTSLEYMEPIWPKLKAMNLPEKLSQQKSIISHCSDYL